MATVAVRGTMPVVLGGNHYCTLPAFRGYAEGVGHDAVGRVQIDAHTDTASDSAVYSEHFHGSSTHHVATSAFRDYGHISQASIRGCELPGTFEFTAHVGLDVYTSRDVADRGAAAVVTDAVEAATEGTDAVYVTFDIDTVDPSVAPGTEMPELAGLDGYEALIVMETLGAHEAVGAVDLVEVAPPYGPTDTLPGWPSSSSCRS